MATTRTFTWDDQLAFARLAGDANPVHVDPLAARRTMFGGPIVHGLHVLAWALEAVCENPVSITALRATFTSPVRPGETVRCIAETRTGDTVHFTVEGEVRRTLTLDVTLAPSRDDPQEILPEAVPEEACEDLTFEQATKRAGHTPLALDGALATRLLPRLARSLDRVQLAELLAMSRVVGMRCPGVHSILSEIVLRAHAGGDRATLDFRVARVDADYSAIHLAVQGPTLRGTVRTFFRPPPQRQPDLGALATMVRPGEFTRQRALVIGGSRGLGEVMAKLVAIGGGDVILTYARGAADAARVAREIAAASLRARAVAFDCLRPDDLAGALAGVVPTHLYYFATPFIGSGGARFSAERFAELCRYYVAGFDATVRAVRKLGDEPLDVLYPSTIFLAEPEPGLAEYRAAKAAGEALCDDLASTLPRVRLHVPRLPRLSTDQTLSILARPAAEPAAVLLDVLRRMTPPTA